jgi:hypothetical protein
MIPQGRAAALSSFSVEGFPVGYLMKERRTDKADVLQDLRI